MKLRGRMRAVEVAAVVDIARLTVELVVDGQASNQCVDVVGRAGTPDAPEGRPGMRLFWSL
jgi:hypothetical protein